MLEVGQVVDGKFRILRLIGEGGMGSVYEAQHAFLGRRVAIKVLAPDYAHNRESVQRFYREAQAAARIGHENICEVTDIGQTDGAPYIVMQLLQGKSLAQAIAESAPFPVGRAVDIAQQTLEALAAAHAADIVHRDMKPDNIFLTKVAGRDDFVKLLDFGISKIRQAGSGAKLTQEGTVLGTPQYMAPEQARGESDVDGRVDVWAVGIIVFEMLTGRIPFDGENYNKIIFQVAAGPIPRLRALREGITPELEDVVMRGMERDLARRFPTVLEFRDALVRAWMGTGESGFAVQSAPSPPPAIGYDATDLAPALMLADVKGAAPVPKVVRPAAPAADVKDAAPVPKAVRPPAPAADPQAARGGAAPVSNIYVAEPAATVGASSSSSGVPTSPRGMVAPSGPAAHDTVETPPDATLALPGAATDALAPRSRRVPLVPAVILGVVVVATAAYFLVRQIGSSATGGPADGERIAAVQPDARAALPQGAIVASQDSGDRGAVESRLPSVATETAGDASGEDAGAEPEAVVEQPRPPESIKPVSDAEADTERAPDAAPEATAPLATTGRLTVATTPTTQVFLDGDPLGSAPFSNREVAAGPHRILFLNEAEGIRHEERLVIVAGRVSLLRRTAEQLGVAAPPPAETDAGAEAAPVDAGRIPDGIRIRTDTYGRDAG